MTAEGFHFKHEKQALVRGGFRKAPASSSSAGAARKERNKPRWDQGRRWEQHIPAPAQPGDAPCSANALPELSSWLAPRRRGAQCAIRQEGFSTRALRRKGKGAKGFVVMLGFFFFFFSFLFLNEEFFIQAACLVKFCTTTKTRIFWWDTFHNLYLEAKR